MFLAAQSRPNAASPGRAAVPGAFTVGWQGIEPERTQVLTAHEQWVARTSWPRLALADADRKWPEQFRHQARGLLMHWGLKPLSDRVETVVTELVSNALVHGGGDSIGFRLTLTDGGLLVEVADSSTEPARLVHTGPDAESGRGLLLVEAFADDWGVNPRSHADGKWTWAAFNTTSEVSC
ncbi:ATP-binding protein [Streptomyces sp. SID1034]|uniref:ATP-binding protein n=1 Tax=Streptomyces TaxID=1883 RepID=UPI0013713AA0|nr:ATP-binding protein [Streptomyces sp. SID1034]MYV95309.1 hypothetical protein [Streptomyces sp. SID1034]